MIKRLSKKVIAIFLSVCTLISTMALSVPVVSAADNKSDSSVKYISEICVSNATSESYAKKTITDKGYTLVDHNFNEKSKSSVVYLGYKTTNNVEDALTGLVFSNDTRESINYGGRTYYSVSSTNPGATLIPGANVNFNSDEKQISLYLYYTKEADPYATTEYITNLDAVGTSNSDLQGKDYKTVVSAKTGKPQNLNEPFVPQDFENDDPDMDFDYNERPYIYLAYQSEMSANDLYQKLGNDDLDAIVKSVNGINYYNFDSDVNKSDFLINALSQQYSGNSAVKSWAQVLYAMMGIKGEGNGYQNRIGSSFDNVFGKGEYVDLVAALTNGAGTEHTQYGRGMLIQSTGLKTTSGIANVRNEMLNLFTGIASYDCNNHNLNDPNEIGKYLVKQDLFENVKSSSDVVYTLCRVSDDSAASGHDVSVSVIGMMFYNFKLVPLIEDGTNPGNDTLNYDDVYTSNAKKQSSVKIDKNDTGASVNSSKSYSSSVSSSTTNSHASTAGQTYSVTEGLSFGGKIPLLNVNSTVNLSSSQAFNFSETNTVSEAVTQTETNTDGLSYTIPPYSIAAVNCTSADETRNQSYDCPIALTYDVAFLGSGCELAASNLFRTSFAYISDYYATFGAGENSAVDVLHNIYKSNGSKTDGFTVKCIDSNNFNSYSSDEWNKILNKNIASNEYSSTAEQAIKFITSNQPMSYLGGKFTSNISSVSYTFDKYYALYPIDKIKIYKTKPASSAQTLVQHIDLDSDGSYRLQDYYNTISAFDEHNSDWTNWDPTQGYWALITDDPSTGEEKIIKITSDPVSDGIVSAYKDSKTGLIYITPLKNGKSYIRYVINDNVFQYYPNVPGDATEFSTLNLKYVTNDDITAKGTIEINTSNIEHNYDENGFCKSCGAYQPAYLNSDGVYEIGNAGHLFWFSSLVNGDRTHADFDSQNGAANAVLVKDIVVNNVDMSKLASTQSDSLRKWNPIGTYDNSYSGNFDGKHHTVSGLYFNDSNVDNVGLFGYTRGGAKISNVGVLNSYFKGKNCVGGILGRNNNSGVTVQRCFSEATVIGNEGVGGISGSTYGGKIIDCYNVGSVTGNKFVGSIRGRNTNSSGAMDNCFNVGEVIGTGTENIGGIRGDGNGTISNCYCISTKLTDTAAATKTPEQFASGEVAYLLNHSVTDGKQIWYQNIDNGATHDNYPKFDGGTVYYLEYKDTYSNTYSEPPKPDAFDKDDDGNLIIKTYDDLVKLSNLIRSDYDIYGSQNYILTNNIKADDSAVWTQGIGSFADNKPFNGTFDGNGYCIIGLNVNAPEYGGLFEIIGESGCVKNLLVFDCEYTASSKTAGGIAAVNDGTIDHCISGVNLTTGVIHFPNRTIDAAELNSKIKGDASGGIVGENNGLITGCRNASVVSGTQCGGIACVNTGKIYGCANNAKIGTSNSSASGGLVGKNGGIIESSYNSGSVNGKSENAKGAIAGINGYDKLTPAITNVFYLTVNGLNAVGADSAKIPDDTNIGMSKSSDFQSSSFVDRLNEVSDDSVVWVHNSYLNKGYPTIKGNFLKISVKSAGNNITVKGCMHENLNIKYDACGENDNEYSLLSSSIGENKILKVYSVSMTDNNGNYIPAELWCQGEFEISVPVDNSNVQFAGMNTDGEITYYEPDSVENGIAVFTVSHPTSFAVVETAKKNISADTDTSVVRTTNDGTPIQTGTEMCCGAILLVAVLSFVLIFSVRRRNRIE